jgi:hypothetical protein
VNNTYDCLLNQAQYSQLNLGSALANSVAATDITAGANTAGEAFTLPASYLQVGMQFRVKARGIISNTGTPTLLLGLYYGGVAGTALATTGAVATVASLSNNIWSLDADLRIDGVGTGGAIRTLGVVSGPYAAATSLPASSSSGNSVSVNTSTANILTVGATWGTASASNTLQVVMFTVERLNEGGA